MKGENYYIPGKNIRREKKKALLGHFWPLIFRNKVYCAVSN